MSDEISFQTKLLHGLIDFYLEINKTFKRKHQHEMGQLVSLNFLVETIILSGGSETSKGSGGGASLVVLNMG